MKSQSGQPLEPVGLTDATIDDEFWSPRIETVRETTLDFVHERLVESGRIENFRVAAGRTEGEFQGRFYNDSDVYKWLEGACLFLATGADDDLRERIFPDIRQEYEDTVNLMKEITGRESLLKRDWLEQNLDRRNPYVDPLNLLQVRLLAQSHLTETERRTLRLTVQGIAAGMKNTG